VTISVEEEVSEVLDLHLSVTLIMFQSNWDTKLTKTAIFFDSMRGIQVHLSQVNLGEKSNKSSKFCKMCYIFIRNCPEDDGEDLGLVRM
jgi:hypothetical protein